MIEKEVIQYVDVELDGILQQKKFESQSAEL